MELQKRALAWTESLLEDDVSRADFKTAVRLSLPPSSSTSSLWPLLLETDLPARLLTPPSGQCSHLTRTTYLQILHERHLSDLCAYPLCARPPRRPYRAFPLPRSRIVTTPAGGRLVVNVTGNDDDGFCGPACRRRAEWVARVDGAFGDGLWDDGEDGAVRIGRWKLLEEVEEGGADEIPPASDAAPPTPPPPAAKPPADVEPETPPVSDIISALRIVENPTPVAAPAPPQLQPFPPPAHSSQRPPVAAPPLPLSTNATAAEIREHERRRRADASNSSLVPADILGFADSLITSAAPVPGASPGDEGASAEGEAPAAVAAEALDEEDEAWGLMEAARQEIDGPP